MIQKSCRLAANEISLFDTVSVGGFTQTHHLTTVQIQNYNNNIETIEVDNDN